MKQINGCENIEEIRKEIGGIDLQIIKLMGNERDYVPAASKYKKDRNSAMEKGDVNCL